MTGAAVECLAGCGVVEIPSGGTNRCGCCGTKYDSQGRVLSSPLAADGSGYDIEPGDRADRTASPEPSEPEPEGTGEGTVEISIEIDGAGGVSVDGG